MRLKALTALLVVASLALAGIAAAQESAPRDSGYRVGPGDTIKVNAYTHSEISGEFSVEGSGDISYPLLGEVVVAGKTTGEIAQLLERLLEKDLWSEQPPTKCTITGLVERTDNGLSLVRAAVVSTSSPAKISRGKLETR